MIILVRHGQTAANAGGRLLGRADLPLTSLGRRQAAAVSSALSPLSVARVVTSPLLRCRETAEALALPVPAEVDDRWIELDYGEYEGVPLGSVPAAVWARWRAEPEWAPAGGESLVNVARRVREACGELAGGDGTGRDVVVVSHVSPIKAAVAWAVGAGDDAPWRMFLDVAAISRIAVGPLGPSLRSFNETAHLAGL